jgi:DNA polymerase-3 subunit gamma/tau
MSYLVLARKWRPKRFAELVGQEHVVRALTNALDSGRVHHAFLFTGTRGVGKTTIARIFAKSLNCEQGRSAEPCGVCDVCTAIDAGRFIDLLEIDAASNTGVDDVRELIENAQYMPSRGRVKVYLIDEVHMLSKSAFNALLKTLEEPPGHVKFLLATTDPQKLPVTVLSRCLQFNLKRLDEAQIGGQMRMILEQEGIVADEGAILQLAKGADGSLRDGLSLLDQAIAYTGSSTGGSGLEDAAVAAMLGTVDRTRVGALLDALGDGDGARLLAEVAQLAEFSPDWGNVLDALAEALHRVQVLQLVPGAAVDAGGLDVEALAARLRPELVQLWYQMALNGRRDLSLAPSPRAGFEMSVLRMLAFRPDTGAARAQANASATTQASAGAEPSARHAAADAARAALAADAGPVRVRPASPAAEQPKAPAVRAAPAPSAAISESGADAPETSPVSAQAAQPPAAASDAAPTAAAIDADGWLDLVATSGLRGPARQLAEHSGFIAHQGGILRLSLSQADEHLKGPVLVKMLADALAPRLGGAPQIRFELAPDAAAAGETLHVRNERQRDQRQSAAEEAFLGDPGVQRLMQAGARVVPDSIRPIDD